MHAPPILRAGTPERTAQAAQEFLRDKPPMVPWYDIGQLLATGRQVAESALLGQRADFRLIEALAAPQGVFEDRADEPELWLDYVADVGDGFDSTFSVARMLALPQLNGTTAGGILVMGGDAAYPMGNRDTYARRLATPYEAAAYSPGAQPARMRSLFALPGNHDWYDGLVSFSRQFCQERSIGLWRTHQRRSYFALRLPRRHWLLAFDIQLETDIDGPQKEYFRRVADHMQAGDRLIVCTALPHWIHPQTKDSSRLAENVDYLERFFVNERRARVVLRLAGDMHYYRRHVPADEPAATASVHHVIAGGGGAFLHPTHAPALEDLHVMQAHDETNEQHLVEARPPWPDQATSRALGHHILRFPLTNPTFGLLTAILYSIFGWLLPAPDRAVSPLARLGVLAADLANQPLRALVFVVPVLGVMAFTDTHKRWYRVAGGGCHGVAHVAAALAGSLITGALATVCLTTLVPSGPLGRAPWLERLALFGAASVLQFLWGWLVGAALMGFYLWVSLQIFGRHGNEAFSALRVDRWKHFIRMHITPAGGLDVVVLGIDQPCRSWRARAAQDLRPGEPVIDAAAPEPPVVVVDRFSVPPG